MKGFKTILAGLMFSVAFAPLALASNKVAAPVNDYEFQQDRMQLSQDSVIAISTFDNQDHVTAYSFSGVRLWNAPFHAKIVSWRIAGDYVFIFSKDRNGTRTYITCINRHNGGFIWQRP